MMDDLVYGFLDESPSLPSKDLFFCVDIITSNEKMNKKLADILMRARKKIVKKKLKFLSEFKFYHSDDKTRCYILSQLAKCDIEIVVLVVDKQGKLIKDTPENYGIVVGVSIAELLKIHPVLNLTTDKKFTNSFLEGQFLSSSQETAFKFGPKGASVFFNPPADSERERALQLADFVAGAFHFKYNRNDNHYAELIKEKVIVEKVVKWVDIKKRMVKP